MNRDCAYEIIEKQNTLRETCEAYRNAAIEKKKEGDVSEDVEFINVLGGKAKACDTCGDATFSCSCTCQDISLMPF